MKDFEPSSNFVARVMENVRDYEGTRKMEEPLGQRLLASRTLRFVFSSGAALLGILNLIRLYFSVLSPVVCR
jgi:hypothetical protein